MTFVHGRYFPVLKQKTIHLDNLLLLCLSLCLQYHCIDPKGSKRSDRRLNCSPFRLHRFDPLLYGNTNVFKL